MAIEQGIIESVSANQAKVRMERSSACASCGSRHMCYSGSGYHLVVEVDNGLPAKIGDRVEISMPTGALLRLSLLVYCAPIAALLAGAYMGQAWAASVGAQQTAAAVAGGAAALVTAFYGLKRFDRAAGKKRKYVPRITRILPAVQPTECPTQYADSR